MALIKILRKHSIKLSFAILLVGGTAYIFGTDPKYTGYSPDQPIPFSHKIHAGELQMDCQFCHVAVERSVNATVPDTATCMKCHEFIASDSLAIQYLRQSYSQGIPVRWIKVHDLPDHARFSHKPHVARGLDCTQCHGDVKNMDRVEVFSAFNMGWCVNCHRDYTARLALQETGPGHNHTIHLSDCGTCHY